MWHAADTYERHVCGGTILRGGEGDLAHHYCDRCGAFRYLTDSNYNGFPTGTDEQANGQAWNDGEERSPEADSVEAVLAMIAYDVETHTLTATVFPSNQARYSPNPIYDGVRDDAALRDWANGTLAAPDEQGGDFDHADVVWESV